MVVVKRGHLRIDGQGGHQSVLTAAPQIGEGHLLIVNLKAIPQVPDRAAVIAPDSTAPNLIRFEHACVVGGSRNVVGGLCPVAADHLAVVVLDGVGVPPVRQRCQLQELCLPVGNGAGNLRGLAVPIPDLPAVGAPAEHLIGLRLWLGRGSRGLVLQVLAVVVVAALTLRVADGPVVGGAGGLFQQDKGGFDVGSRVVIN